MADETEDAQVAATFGHPTPARMYDYFLGGKDNFEVDRVAAEALIARLGVAKTKYVAWENRRFLWRAVEYFAGECGVSQFIDVGAGLPTMRNTHEIARAVNPDARVVYVDNDPVVTAHSRTLLAAVDGVEAIEADLRQPERILASPECSRLIDFSEPVGVLFVAVLHFIEDRDEPHGIVRAFADSMVPGSYLALSHITGEGTDPVAATSAVCRTESDIRAFFGGFELADPGLTDVTRWSPRAPAFSAEPGSVRVLAGIGRKRGPAAEAFEQAREMVTALRSGAGCRCGWRVSTGPGPACYGS